MFTKFARGMVYWTDIPRYDINPNVQAGMRPCIIISNNVSNCSSPNVTIVPCTTNIDKGVDQPTHLKLNLTTKEESLVLCEDIITVNKNLLKTFMGMLDEVIMKEVDKCIATQLSLIHIDNPYLGNTLKTKPKEQQLEEKAKRNQGRRVSGPVEMQQFLNFYQNHTAEETMAEYGVPTKSALHQRIQWYKGKLNMK